MNLKKIIRKRSIFMGVFFGIFYSLIMTLAMRYSDNLITNLIYFAFMALVSGTLYGLAMYCILRKQQKNLLNSFPALEQKLIISEQASFRLSTEKPKSVSGWCLLTADSLYFSAELKKQGNFSIEIPFNQVTALKMDYINGKDCVKIESANQPSVLLRFGNNSTNWAILISKTAQAMQAQETAQSE